MPAPAACIRGEKGKELSTPAHSRALSALTDVSADVLVLLACYSGQQRSGRLRKRPCVSSGFRSFRLDLQL